jgi:hypothetical protein
MLMQQCGGIDLHSNNDVAALNPALLPIALNQLPLHDDLG